MALGFLTTRGAPRLASGPVVSPVVSWWLLAVVDSSVENPEVDVDRHVLGVVVSLVVGVELFRFVSL